MLTLPLPPGNYILHQGLPALITLAREGEPLYPPTGSYNRETIDFFYNDGDRVEVIVRSDSRPASSCQEIFDKEQPELKKAILDRFKELFSLEIGPRGNEGPRAVRTNHYRNNPVVVTVKAP